MSTHVPYSHHRAPGHVCPPHNQAWRTVLLHVYYRITHGNGMRPGDPTLTMPHPIILYTLYSHGAAPHTHRRAKETGQVV